MLEEKIREALYETYSKRYTVTNKIIEKNEAYILINSIDTDFNSYSNNSLDIRKISVILELRSYATTTKYLAELEDFVLNSFSEFRDTLLEKEVEVLMLNIRNTISNNILEEDFYSKTLDFNLTIKNK